MRARRILACYDLDIAGETGAARLAGMSARVRRVTPTSGAKDVTAMYLAGVDLRAWIIDTLGDWYGPYTADLDDPLFQAVVSADLAQHGVYRSTRTYDSPSEDIVSIWHRAGLVNAGQSERASR